MPETSLLSVFQRWWWLLALGAVLGAIGGVLIASVLPKVYESTADALVGPVNTDTGLDASGSLAATYRDLTTSRESLAEAIKATGEGGTPDELRKNVSVSSNTLTRIVTITARDGDPEVAAKLAGALAGRLERTANAEQGSITNQLDALLADPVLQEFPEQRQNAVRRAAARVFGASQAGRVTIVNAAVPADNPSSPNKKLLAILGAMAGVLLTGLFAILRESRSGAPQVDVVRAAA